MITNARKLRKPKVHHAGLLTVSLENIEPSPENDDLYRPANLDDPEIIALADSIREHGVREPIVVSLDGFILSGHRRYVAAKIADLDEVPVRHEQIRREDDIDAFVILLREYNRQRTNTLSETLREELVNADPDEAYQSLIAEREERSIVSPAPMALKNKKRRKKISKAKAPMLERIDEILEDQKKYWPLSDRRIHYEMGNDPPLKHASKPDSVYENDAEGRSYNSLCELLTRARLVGRIPFEAISDSTRPVTTWHVHQSPGPFMREQIDGFMKGYWRDLMQSQPNHIEIVGEKNTVDPIIKEVAVKYCIPVTTGRGFCSLDPRHEMNVRYRKSGKNKLVLLLVTDFDPAGETIAESFARSIRDDFGVENIHPIQVALTYEQVTEFNLPRGQKVKKKKSRADGGGDDYAKLYQEFVDKYGKFCWELEALTVDQLQGLLTEAIDSVIGIKAFNAELEAERKDAEFLYAARSAVHDTLQSILSEL